MVNWNILQPVDIGGAFDQGWQTGQKQRAETETRNALASLVKNPNDQNAINALAPHDAMLAMQFQDRNRQQQNDDRVRGLRVQAAGGDPEATRQLAGDDPDFWAKLNPQDKDAVKRRADFIGQAALNIGTLPPEQRAAAWDAAIDQGVSLGYSDLAQFRGQYSPQALDGAIYNAGLVNDRFEADSVKYTVLPQGATMVPVSQRTGLVTQENGAGYSTTPPPPPPIVQGPDAEDLDMLKSGQVTPAQFDEVFGQGMSQKYMNGGSTPQASSGFPAN